MAKHLYRPVLVARHYRCFQRSDTGASWVIESFERYDDLAQHVRKQLNRLWRALYEEPLARPRLLRVEAPNGDVLDLDGLSAHAGAINWARYLDNRYPGYVRRQGAVPGIHCFRGGRGYFRRVATTSERREAALVLRCEGETAPRAARNARNLPNSWDDCKRVVDHNWKSQHKGLKAWDRIKHGSREAFYV